MDKIFAVLTGDLIGSTQASRDAVDACLDRIAALYGKANGFSRFRGDGWQILLDQPGQGLWAMVRIAADLRAAGGLESRIALGLGTVEHVDHDNLSSASGEAFIASGRALSAIADGDRFAIAGKGVDALHARLIVMIDERASNWSVEQATAAAIAMESFPLRRQTEIAERLGITRQAVAARLATSGFQQVVGATADFFSVFGDGRPWNG